MSFQTAWTIDMRRSLASELVEDARDFKLAGTPAMQLCCAEWVVIIANRQALGRDRAVKF